MIELKKVDAENIWDVVALSVKSEQENFVATNTESILEAFVALSAGDVALPFGIYNDDALIGFVMFGYGDTGDEDEPQVAQGNYCIWRLMIDKNFEGQGFGKQAVKAALRYLKSGPAGHALYCWLSYAPQNSAAQNLYRFVGFQENGERCGDEIVAVIKL